MIFGWFRHKPRIEKSSRMMVAVDQTGCTADGVCETWCIEVFTQLPSGKYGVRERKMDFLVDTIFDGLEGEGHGPDGLDGWARVPTEPEEAVEYVVKNCAGECVFIRMTGDKP